MSKKPKVKVVVGDLAEASLVEIFECLSDACEVSLYAIENERMLQSYKCNMPLHVFERLPDMPGYMRNLNEFIDDADILIGFESSRLSTFQMVRTAVKRGLPSAVVVNEFHPFFYANYSNIRAIQLDVIQNASVFLPSSKLAEGMLKMEGVAHERIHPIHYGVNLGVSKRDQKVRAKFRDHVGIPEDAIVLLAPGDLDTRFYPFEILEAVRLLKVTNPDLGERIRLVFAGNGPSEKELKYRCYDSGMGASAVFIHQETARFIGDLYHASDFIFGLSRLHAESHEEFPVGVLEAAGRGVVPIYSQGSVLAEYLSGAGIALSEVKSEPLCESLEKVLTAPGGLGRAMGKVSAALTERCDRRVSRGLLLELVDGLVKKRQTILSENDHIVARLEMVEQKLHEGKSEDAIVELENILVSFELSKLQKSSVMSWKGRALEQMSRLDDAVTAYQDSLILDEENIGTLRSLGYLALKSHSHEEALSFFKKVLSKMENDADAMLGVGLVHRRLGLNDEAIYWLDRCIGISKGANHRRAISALLQACNEAERVALAIGVLEKLRESYPDQSPVILTLGQLYLKAGRAEQGNQMVQEALAMDLPTAK